MSRYLQFALFITFVLLTVIVTPTLATAAPRNPENDQLLKQAQKKLDVEYNALITGDTTELTKATPEISGRAAETKNDVAETQLRRNKMLADHGQRYTKFLSKLTLEKAEVVNDNATVTARENVTLTLVDKNASEPVLTKESKTHVFRFVLQGGKWTLIEDSILDGFVPVLPEAGMQKITDSPVSLDVTIKPNEVDSQSTKQSGAKRDTMTLAAAMSGTFNRSNAVTYARRYWGPNNSNYNTAYRTFGNDCTNFTSQAMNWGGWQHIGGWYDDTRYWWYDPTFPWEPSWGAGERLEAGSMSITSTSSHGTQGEVTMRNILRNLISVTNST